MALPQDFLSELTARTDMVSLVNRYTTLTQKGGLWVGLCPFHNEKTPSFNLSRDNTMYYCFGCGAGGGVIQFLMKAENMDFIEAVRELARQAGLDMPEDDSQGQTLRRARLLEINTLAARWFYENLKRPEGAAALEYMRLRGIHPKTARQFGLGAAPDAWDSLSSALSAQKVTQEELLLSGLVSENKRGGLTDAFRDRLMFPIFDPGGQVIAFSGRALKDGAPAKYKNSRETGVYNKSRTLYGLHRAKNSERPYFILVEGNVDVPMLHQHGFDSALASCGTALTDAQAILMARYKHEVVLAYDSDQAGQEAVRKAIPRLEASGLKTRVLALSGAKDPDEYLKRYGPGAMEALLSGAKNQMDYRLSQLAAGLDLDTDEGRRECLRAGEKLLAELPSEAERQVYAHRVAEMAGVTQEAVLRDLSRAIVKNQRKAAKNAERALIYPRTDPNASRPGGLGSGGAEEELLLHMARAPEYLQKARESLNEEDFSDPIRRELFVCLRDERAAAALSERAAALLARLLGERPGIGPAELSDHSWEGTLSRLRELRLRSERPESDQDLLALRKALNK